MTEDEHLYKHWQTGERFTRDELEDAWQDDCNELRALWVQQHGADDEFDAPSFDFWLSEQGTYLPVEEWDDEDPNEDLTIDRQTAEAQDGQIVTLYRYFDDRFLSLSELIEKLKPQSVVGPDYDWGDYIARACQVGTFRKEQATAQIVRQYAQGDSRCTYEYLRDEWRPQLHEVKQKLELPFAAFLGELVEKGVFLPVEVLVYTSCGEGAAEELAVRVIVD